jgi:hypothetical protein
MKKLGMVVSALAMCSLPSLAFTQAVDRSNESDPLRLAQQATTLQDWRVNGGDFTIAFNFDLLADLGVKLQGDFNQRMGELHGVSRRSSDRSALYFQAPFASAGDNNTLSHFSRGAIVVDQALQFSNGNDQLEMSQLTVRHKPGSIADFELADEFGNVWFDIDHVHYELSNNRSRLLMRNMDLRATERFADWLGNKQLTGTAIGSMSFDALVSEMGSSIKAPESCAAPNWHGTSVPGSTTGEKYQTDVQLITMASLDYKRCRNCDGPNPALNGEVVFAPSASLRNNVTNTTADVPWRRKFTGNFPPYQNDQHPFLIWNVYRMRKDAGAIRELEHIGRSGVKHAFLTVNTNCLQVCSDNQILWLGCGDVYGSGNNDSTTDLGPRTELIPYQGVWARCGSIYDPNCDGTQDATGAGSYDNRMLIREAHLSDTTNYDYFFEGWYVIRDDVNIQNSMGYRKFTPSFGSTWSATQVGAFNTGSVLDQWLAALPAPSSSLTRQVTTDFGRLRLAVRVESVGSEYLYHYVLHNIDYNRAQTEVVGGNASNVRMLSQSALRAVDFGSVANVIAREVLDGNTEATDWTSSNSPSLRFQSDGATNELRWGTSMSFVVRSSGAPVIQNVSIEGATAAETLSLETLVPGGTPDSYLINGFE